VLKGPYLAEHLYADPAARPMSDLDLLVSRKNLALAERILLDRGYGPGAPWRPSPEWSCTTSHALPPLWKEGATLISMHWTLEDPRSRFTIDVDQIWRRT